MKTRQTDILICGGGIAGLTLAAILGRAGMRVVLVENAPPAPLKDTKISSRTVALMESSLNIIKASGVWDRAAPYSCAMRTMRIIDDSMAGKDAIESEFHSADISHEQFGFNIPNGFLRAALFEHVQSIKQVTVLTGALTGYEARGPHILARLKDGTQIEASLIIGADGRNSAVRDLAGIKAKITPYGQNAVTCLINHSRAHNHTSSEFHRPGGPLAFVPLKGNQCAVVWVEKEERTKEILRLKKHEFEQSLQKLSRGILGGITLESGPETWPLASLKAENLSAERMVLIAEAAHVMSPITAQGLNLSLRDVAALAEEIIDAARLGLDIGAQSVTAKYERRRRMDIGTRVMGVDSMNRIVSTEALPLKSLRRAGLKTVDRVAPLKHFAMRQALAPQVDQGRLARGERL